MLIGVIFLAIILGAVAGVVTYISGYGLLAALAVYAAVGVISVLTVCLCLFLISRRNPRLPFFGVSAKGSSNGSETDSRI